MKQQTNLDAVAAAAEVLLGTEWHRELARVLGPRHPDGPRASIDPRLVRRWASGARVVPEWVPIALSGLLREQASSMVTSAAALESQSAGCTGRG
jgi:hypothetical protein